MNILTIRQLALLFVCAFWDCIGFLVSGTILFAFTVLPLVLAVAAILAVMTEDWVRLHRPAFVTKPLR